RPAMPAPPLATAGRGLVGAIVGHRLDRAGDQVGVELRPRGARHAVRRPRVHKVGVVGEVVPRVDVAVPGSHDVGVLAALLGQVVGDSRGHAGTTGHGQTAAFTEVVLYVNDDQCFRHHRSSFLVCRTSRAGNKHLRALGAARRRWGSRVRPATFGARAPEVPRRSGRAAPGLPEAAHAPRPRRCAPAEPAEAAPTESAPVHARRPAPTSPPRCRRSGAPPTCALPYWVYPRNVWPPATAARPGRRSGRAPQACTPGTRSAPPTR